MSYNGSGTFNINSTGQPVVAGTVITASAFNALTTDLATGLTTAITKDGQTTTTARITFAQGITSSLVTDSSSVSTGSIITDGGVGIAKNLYVGGTLNVTGSTSLTNPVINNIKMGYTTTATAAGTTTLTVASNYRQFFTGSTTQTIVLPVTSTLVTGMAYEIENNSTGLLTVNSSGGNLVGTIPAGVCAHAVCIGTTLTTAADWDWDYISTTTITGTGANVLGTSPTIATPTITGDATISGLTVGKGGGTVSTNTAVGVSALNATNTGGKCTAFGYQALTLTTGKENTAVGSGAGASMTSGEGLAAFGWNAANLNTADNVTALGHNTLGSNTTGANNTAVGNAALNVNTTGASNTAVGRQALVSNTTASNNTAVGYQSLNANTTGLNNTVIGSLAGDAGTFNYSTIIGSRAGGVQTSGDQNTYVGEEAGGAMTTGSRNTLIGRFGGNSGGLDIRTSSNYIVLSDGDGNPRMSFNGSGYANIGSATYTAKLRVEDATVDLYGGYNAGAQKFAVANSGQIYSTSGSISVISDQRQKENIRDLDVGLAEVMALQPRRFDWKEGSGTDKKDVAGFIAQEVEVIFPDLIDRRVRSDDDDTEYLSLRINDLVPTLVKAIQELKTIVDAQDTEITALKAKVGI